MPAKTVTLDALIPRDDFATEHIASTGGNPRQTIGVPDLAHDGFFQNSLRKPDFQRETTHWAPPVVVDLIRAFLDGDLIPAVILWERGDEVFVIDGAHRLSAIIAWIRNDYGDGKESIAFFKGCVTEEQKKIAEKTRKMVNQEIGPYYEFAGLVGQEVADNTKARRLSAIGKNSILIQWVTAATVKAAEDSFFKINQAAQPIDPVERNILQSRTAPNAIASRCIVRGGSGHKYWSAFDSDTQTKIEELGADLYNILFKPPHSEPITSSDVPIAGYGYSALPFVFNLVSLCNGLKIPNTHTNKRIEKPLPPDNDGAETVKFLKNVKSRLEQVSTNDTGSLGFHPLAYCYARSGNFLSNAFLASLVFAEKLNAQRQKDNFTKVRERFEQYLHENKLFVSLTIHRLGSGARSLERIADLYWQIFDGMRRGHSDADILNNLTLQKEFAHLKLAEVPPPSAEMSPSKKGASKTSKSAAFIREAFQNSMKCPICGGLLHKNSMSFDHIRRQQDGGDHQSDNLQPTHPYCNSGYKG